MIDWDKKVLAPLSKAFGEPVEYYPLEGSPIRIIGVFDEAYMEQESGGDFPGACSTSPVLGVRQSCLIHEPEQGDECVIRGHRYAVREPRPDGHGHILLILNHIRREDAGTG